jgi:hypothetical protein
MCRRVDFATADAVEVILVNVDDFHAILNPELVRNGPADLCNLLKIDGAPVMGVMEFDGTD